MKLDELTIGEVKQIASLLNKEQTTSPFPFEIGANYLIRTVTMIDTGKLVAVTPTELVIEDAAWIADTGRWQQALESVNFVEVEPYPKGQVIIGRGALIDAVKINTLPRSQK